MTKFENLKYGKIMRNLEKIFLLAEKRKTSKWEFNEMKNYGFRGYINKLLSYLSLYTLLE